MSKESFREFVTKLQKDQALQQELRKIGDPEKGIAADKVAAFAAGKGYKFGVEEISGELSEDQLGKVAGGATIDYFMKWDSASKFMSKIEFPKVAFNFSTLLNKKTSP